MTISQIPCAIATNEVTGEQCIFIQHRSDRGTPSHVQIVAGTLLWTAQDGMVEQIGDLLSLPASIVDHWEAGHGVLIIPINDRGIPCRDFFVTPE